MASAISTALKQSNASYGPSPVYVSSDPDKTTVVLVTARLDILCRTPNGSLCRPHVAFAVDQATGFVFAQSVHVQQVKSRDTVMLLNRVRMRLDKAGKYLGAVIVGLGPEFRNLCFTDTCLCYGVTVFFASPRIVMGPECYLRSLERFAHVNIGQDPLEICDLQDVVRTYAEQIYNG